MRKAYLCSVPGSLVLRFFLSTSFFFSQQNEKYFEISDFGTHFLSRQVNLGNGLFQNALPKSLKFSDGKKKLCNCNLLKKVSNELNMRDSPNSKFVSIKISLTFPFFSFCLFFTGGYLQNNEKNKEQLMKKVYRRQNIATNLTLKLTIR